MGILSLIVLFLIVMFIDIQTTPDYNYDTDDDDEPEEDDENEEPYEDYYDYEEDYPFGAILIKDVPSPNPVFTSFWKGERIIVIGEVSNSPELFLVLRINGLTPYLLTRYDFTPETVLMPNRTERVIDMGAQNFDSSPITSTTTAVLEPEVITTTEALTHKGVDCTHWEVIRETSNDGTSKDFLRCLTTSDKIPVTLSVAFEHIDNGLVHWVTTAVAVAV